MSTKPETDSFLGERIQSLGGSPDVEGGGMESALDQVQGGPCKGRGRNSLLRAEGRDEMQTCLPIGRP